MATISENLQIIKNSTDAIKQAIIDKGGTIDGDISTWANAISGLNGGGSSEEEYVFTGTISYNMTKVTINGYLNKFPDSLQMLFAYKYIKLIVVCNTPHQDTSLLLFSSI